MFFIQMEVLLKRGDIFHQAFSRLRLYGKKMQVEACRNGAEEGRWLCFFWLHSRKLTWNLRIQPWERKIIFQIIIFSFYVNLRGCTLQETYIAGNGKWTL